MLVKNQVYEAIITDYTAEGQGVAKIEGCAVFIPNAIRGEKCLVRIEKVGKTWAAGKMEQLLEKSPHRVNRECPVAKLCGGCDFWHMDYAEEAALKADRVRSNLNRMAGENLPSLPILEAPTCYNYRNKAIYPVAAKKGRVYAGFYRAGSHEIVENEGCRILFKEADMVKAAVVDFFNHYRLSAYDEKTHKGLLRHIFVRQGAVSKELLVMILFLVMLSSRRSMQHYPNDILITKAFCFIIFVKNYLKKRSCLISMIALSSLTSSEYSKLTKQSDSEWACIVSNWNRSLVWIR